MVYVNFLHTPFFITENNVFTLFIKIWCNGVIKILYNQSTKLKIHVFSKKLGNSVNCLFALELPLMSFGGAPMLTQRGRRRATTLRVFHRLFPEPLRVSGNPPPEPQRFWGRAVFDRCYSVGDRDSLSASVANNTTGRVGAYSVPSHTDGRRILRGVRLCGSEGQQGAGSL